MPCEPFQTKDGVTGLMCSRGQKPRKKCSACRTAWATRLCDFVMEQLHRGDRTCDKPLCDACAVGAGPNRDYCPTHPAPAGAQLAMEGL